MLVLKGPKIFAFLLFCHSYIALLFNALHDAEKGRIIIHLSFANIHSIFRRLIHWVPQGLALRVTLPKVFWPIFSIHFSAKRLVNQVRQGPKSNLPQETTIVSTIYLNFLNYCCSVCTQCAEEKSNEKSLH